MCIQRWQGTHTMHKECEKWGISLVCLRASSWVDSAVEGPLAFLGLYRVQVEDGEDKTVDLLSAIPQQSSVAVAISLIFNKYLI